MTLCDTLPHNPNAEVDVCLLLEGTWPYVRGGVSTWVAQLITQLPHVSFSVVFLGANPDEHGTVQYPIPDNVKHIEVHYLLAATTARPAAPQRRWRDRITRDRRDKDETRFAHCDALHDRLARSEPLKNSAVSEGFAELMSGSNALGANELETHPMAWESLRKRYNDAPPGLDFNHYFWSVRSMHEPLFLLGQIAAKPPRARVYHSVSTGYAGMLGSMIKAGQQRPYLISEHGIYTKERELDLAQVSWIPDAADGIKAGLDDGMGYLRQLWIRFFTSLGRMSYAAADQVFTLYEGNRLRQLKDGADENKLSIIPNGVDVVRLSKVRVQHTTPPPVLLLIGRVVPIKDIKTLIRAMRIVRTHLPDAQAWILGPEDEDEAYSDACKRLVESLDLQQTVRFLGFGSPADVLPKAGLNVLTSVSEGQPLTVLEGFAAGVPALVTDVGSCRELIEGLDDSDRALGQAGAVVPIASPSEFAEAAVELLTDTARWHAARTAAMARVEHRYDERDMVQRYEAVYRQAMQASESDPLRKVS